MVQMIYVVQDVRTQVLKWVRSNGCHLADTILQGIRLMHEVITVQVWRIGQDAPEHTVNVDAASLQHGTRVFSLSLIGEVFEQITVTLFPQSKCIRIQVATKKRGANVDEPFFLRVKLQDGTTVDTSPFEVRSKVKHMTVQQICANIPVYMSWWSEVGTSLASGSPLPRLPRDILDPLHSLGRELRHSQGATSGRKRKRSGDSENLVEPAGKRLSQVQEEQGGNEFPLDDFPVLELEDVFKPSQVTQDGFSFPQFEDDLHLIQSQPPAFELQDSAAEQYAGLELHLDDDLDFALDIESVFDFDSL